MKAIFFNHHPTTWATFMLGILTGVLVPLFVALLIVLTYPN